jgi:glutathione S-transferase
MLELYHNNISVCSQRVRLVLAEKSLPWTSRHVTLTKGEQLTTEFKKLNPRGLVPVLVDDGRVIVESGVICEYLDEVFPDPPLKPADAAARAAMRVWAKLPDDGVHMACATLSFAIAFGRQLQEEHGAGLAERMAKMPDPARRDRQRQLIEKGIEAPFFKDHIKLYDRVIGEMEAQLQKTAWLAGERYSLADIALIPYIERADRLGLAGLWVPERPGVTDWLARFKARPTFKTAIADFPPHDFNDLGQRGLKDWPRIKELISA